MVNIVAVDFVESIVCSMDNVSVGFERYFTV